MFESTKTSQPARTHSHTGGDPLTLQRMAKVTPPMPDGTVFEEITTTPEVAPRVPRSAEIRSLLFKIRDLSVFYGDYQAVRDVNMDIGHKQITAMIGP